MCTSKPVRACLCYPYTFVELKELAEAHGWAMVDDITRAVGCGSGCGLCRPYLAKMLQTGETAFAILPPEEQERERGDKETRR